MPGGHLEYGEDILNCAEREVLEETGLRVRGVNIVTVTNSVFEPEHLHYVTVITYCEVLEPDAEPRVSQTAPPPSRLTRGQLRMADLNPVNQNPVVGTGQVRELDLDELG
jgi:ADP-ribose pyrophosphatase YjhB (NUDIX family)